MPRFEVFVPAAPPAVPRDVTLRIDADNWLAALKAGIGRLGGRGISVSNVLCDVRADGSIHVTAPEGGGVFRIREAAGPPPPPPPSKRGSGAPPRPGAAAPPAAPPGRIGRAPQPAPADVLSEVFERAAQLDRQTDRKSGLAFLLDLAMEKIGCEAGSVFLTRPGDRELDFVVARGPRAEQILKLGLTVPMGVGLVGFCAQEGVCVAVSEAEKDPRFYRAVSQAIGYATRSLLCAPILRKGRVLGALEVLNKRGGRAFEPRDLSVLSYLSHRAAGLLERLER